MRTIENETDVAMWYLFFGSMSRVALMNSSRSGLADTLQIIGSSFISSSVDSDDSSDDRDMGSEAINKISSVSFFAIGLESSTRMRLSMVSRVYDNGGESKMALYTRTKVKSTDSTMCSSTR